MKMKLSLTKSITGFAAISAILITAACANHSHDDGTGHMSAGDGQHDHHKMMQEKHMGDTGGHGHMSVDMKDGMQDGQKGGGHHGGGHHGGAHGGHHGESLAGKPGQESEVDRVINVEANDAMRFVHEPFNIKNGETIKFIITNKGAVPHEFSIGTKDEHMEHGQMMMKNPNMHHGPGGNAITVAPGKTEILIWTFEEAAEVEAACNIPGHYQAGMHSPVKFRP
ncbi:hypothetical protein A3740_05885 [Oleiphilus sp. HI0068]|nr:hypothetical protein A3740_05885 [Oleiphilus sp. HI0068]KZY87637.1 hypothetical protein A3741_01860 [Oleiphilus sp. HI0069]